MKLINLIEVAARRLGVGLVAVGLLFPFAPVAAAQAATSGTASSRELLAKLAGVPEPEAYDVDALSLSLAFEDAENIAGWVAENIAYEVYPGLLRGPDGTLIAHAGNALDQSVLLAGLLLDAGYEVRVALGTLSDEDAAGLVRSMFPARGPGDAAFDLDDVIAALGPESEALSEAYAEVANTNLTSTDVYQEALSETERLLGTIEVPTDLDATQELRNEAANYAWVEYRLSPADPWTAAHPAFGTAGTSPEVEAASYLDGEVPSELTHRLRIEVSIERKRGDEFQVEQLMSPWERPVANLVGVPIVIGNTVMGDVNLGSVEEMRASLAEAAFFAPVLNGGLAPGAQAFDLSGNLVPPDAAASAMAGVFQTVGERLGGAVGALGGLGSDEEPEQPFALTAQYVDFVLVAPGGAEKRFRRTIFDRRDPVARAEGRDELLPETTVLDGVLTMQSVMVSVGASSVDHVMAAMIDQAQAQLDVLDSLVASSSNDSELERGAALFEASGELTTKDHLQLFAAFDAAPHEDGLVSYRAEPTVVSLFGTLALDPEDKSVSGVDIVSNARRVLEQSEDRVVRAFPATVFGGVWDTLMEREFLAARTPAVIDSVPAAGALRRFDSYETLAASGTAVPPAALAALRRDLGAGYTVVVSTGDSVEQAGWSYWRVDAATGTALGVGASGRGVSLEEYLANLQIGLIVSAALSVPSFVMCAASGASWTCYCDVVTSGVALPLGLAYLGALAGATGLIFTVLDITVVAPITTVWTPPLCSSLATRDPEEALVFAECLLPTSG